MKDKNPTFVRHDEGFGDEETWRSRSQSLRWSVEPNPTSPVWEHAKQEGGSFIHLQLPPSPCVTRILMHITTCSRYHPVTLYNYHVQKNKTKQVIVIKGE